MAESPCRVVGIDRDGLARMERERPDLALRVQRFLILELAGKLTDAATLLDRADDFADRTGERYADAHRLLVRARYEYANGRPASVVGATLATPRDTARAQEADGLIRRIDSLATTWGLTSPT